MVLSKNKMTPSLPSRVPFHFPPTILGFFLMAIEIERHLKFLGFCLSCISSLFEIRRIGSSSACRFSKQGA